MTATTVEKSSTWSSLQLPRFILVLLPALIPICLISQMGVNIPLWDAWDPGFVDLAVKSHEGTLGWSDFTAPHNEHRVVIPKIIYFVLFLASRGNEFVLLYAGWGMAVLTSVFIGILCLKTVPRRWGLWVWFFCNLLIFTPSQWENWLGGYGMINFLPLMFIAAGFAVATTDLREWIQFAILLLLASAATFSSLQGFLAWPLFGVIIGWKTLGRNSGVKLRTCLACSAIFILNMALYAISYHAENAGEQHQSVGIGERLQFGLAYLGNPFFNNSLDHVNISILIGSVLLTFYLIAFVLFIFECRSHGRNEHTYLLLNWILIGGFTIVTAMLAMLFRAPVGMQMSVAGRYATCTIYLPIALIGLLSMFILDFQSFAKVATTRLVQVLCWLLAGAFLIVYAMSVDWAWKDSATHNMRSYQGKARLLFINVCADDSMLAGYINPAAQRLRSLVPQLNEMGFIDPPLVRTNNALELLDSAGPSAARGAFGEIKTFTQYPEGTGMLSGWAILPMYHSAAHAMLLTYENEEHQQIIFHIGLMGVATPEIAEKLGDANYAKCGWGAIYGPNELPANIKNVHISAWAIDADKALLYPLVGDIVVRR